MPTPVNAINEGGASGIGNFDGTSAFSTVALSNHAVVVGAGSRTVTNIAATVTTGQIFQNNASADPSWSTATFPSTATSTGTILRADGTNWVATTATYPNTTTINQILYSSSASVVAGLATANQGVLTTGTTGIPVITALATNGQLIIGSTAGAPAAATLSAGTGVSITNAANSITISAVGAGLTWSVITADQTAVVNHGYFCNKAGLLTLTMPATSSVGDVIAFVNINTAAGSKFLSANPGQLNLGTSTATANTGSFTSTQLGDVVFLVCSVANTTWYAYGVQGNITVA